MKLNKRIGALFGTIALAASLCPTGAFAAGAKTPEGTISVTGLTVGDTAKYYQIIEKDTSTGGWKLVDAIAPNTGITLAKVLDGINAEEAGIILGCFSKTGGTSMGTVTETDNGTLTAGSTASPIAVGTYLIVATPADNNTIYAPMFVSADYTTNGNTIEPATADDLAAVAPDQAAVAKKSEVPITKSAEVKQGTAENDRSAQNVGVGDSVTFTVNTKVPSFTEAQDDLLFKVSDSVSTGIEIDTASLKVKVDSGAEKAVVTGGYYNAGGTEGTATSYDYTVTSITATSWEISFSEDYLKRVAGNPSVVVKYDATIKANANVNINELTNTANVEFTHSPDGTHGSKNDKTYHYSYSFDAPVSGNGTENSEEFIKVGVDSEGNPITGVDKVTINNKDYSPLADAEFTLTEVGGGGGSWTSKSLDTGLFSFTGLDAGRYTLKEATPPAGYALDTNTYYVEILPIFNADDGTLESYTVTCGTSSDYSNPVVSSFTISHDNSGNVVASITDPEPAPQIFTNTEVPSLPTTGGAGTLALTMGGVAMIAAGLVLVLQVARKLKAE